MVDGFNSELRQRRGDVYKSKMHGVFIERSTEYAGDFVDVERTNQSIINKMCWTDAGRSLSF
jgi:hypothetical protein